LNTTALAAARAAQRSALKARRRAIPESERRHAARCVAVNVAGAFHLLPGMRVAVYAPMRHELPTAPLIGLLRRHRCRVYLPRITDPRHCRMQFVEAMGPMRPNHLGIAEPIAIRRVATRALDLVFVPLVGFDATGMRLGMGAGYYDRAFAFRRLRTRWRRPRLIGIGYALQQLPAIEGGPHDVRLDAIVTEKEVIPCTTGS
jgi:5-formyltetrahydrofolate cyclo-ligase